MFYILIVWAIMSIGVEVARDYRRFKIERIFPSGFLRCVDATTAYG